MLTIENLVKTFDGGRTRKEGGSERVMAIDGVNFTVEPGHLFTMLGPSGCGKTTTLRCVAGLETPDSGEIRVADRVLYSSGKGVKLRPNERHLGMMFQSYAIWPHMNVFRNVAFPLEVLPRRDRPSKKNIEEKVERVLNAVHLGHLLDRPATDLSGGQQQRLALARALVMEPALLLLDEPLSNLDAKLRDDMRHELKRMQRELGITTIFVTHDQTEALAMSNRIAVMNKGQVEQIGTPRDIYERPSSRFVANFIGSSNFVEGVVTAVEGENYCDVDTAHGKLRVSTNRSVMSGAAVLLSVRPEYLDIEKEDLALPQPNKWSGVVVSRAFLGEVVEHRVQVGGLEVQVRCNPTKSLPAGTEVSVLVNENAVTLLPFE